MGSTEERSELNNGNPEDMEQEDEDSSLGGKPQHRNKLKLGSAGDKSGSDSGNYSSDNNYTSGTDSSAAAATAAATAAASNSRPRHDSNSSVDSARSPSTDRMKRRRTTSLSSSPLSSFFFPSSLQQHPPSTTSTSSTAAASLSTSPSISSILSTSPSVLSRSPIHNMSSFMDVAEGGGTKLGSQGSVLSLDEVVHAVNGVTNMALAHEIALDSNFKLEKFEPPASSIEKQIRDVMHQAFWEILREQLGQQPPVYTQAFVLLQEVRDQLLELTIPHQHKLRLEISEKLDLDLIKQQAQHGVLDFAGYSSYIVELMAKLCAPVRDENIQQLKEESDVVAVFRGVAETLDLMKLDMANYTIQMIRPTIMKQIVEYERGKFKEFLRTQKDGLELTRTWITNHVDMTIREQNAARAQATPTTAGAVSSLVATAARTPPSTGLDAGLAPPIGLLADPLSLRAFCNNALNSAYMELLQWPQDKLIPETACVDSERILEQRDRLQQVCLLSALLLLSLSTVNQNRPGLASSQDQLKARLKKDLCPILDPAYTQSETLAALPNLTEQVLSSLQSYLKEQDLPPLDASTVASLKHQLKDLRQPQHRVTALVTARCVAFLKVILGGKTQARNVSIPGPFVILQEEIGRICGSFLRFTQHNRAVFGEHYFAMVEARLRELNDLHYSNSCGGSSNAPMGSRNPMGHKSGPTGSKNGPTGSKNGPTSSKNDATGSRNVPTGTENVADGTTLRGDESTECDSGNDSSSSDRRKPASSGTETQVEGRDSSSSSKMTSKDDHLKGADAKDVGEEETSEEDKLCMDNKNSCDNSSTTKTSTAAASSDTIPAADKASVNDNNSDTNNSVKPKEKLSWDSLDLD